MAEIERTFHNITDSEYLDESQINFYLKQLVILVNQIKPEDPILYSKQYFHRVISCHHVLGEDYNYICSTNHNRRSFVYCLLESFTGITNNYTVSITEYHQLVELLCSNFNRSVINDAASSIFPIDTMHSPVKYNFDQLNQSVLFHFLYEDWLHFVQKIFIDNGAMSLDKFKSLLYESRQSMYLSIAQPPFDLIENTFITLKSNNKSNSDITFIELRRAIVSNNKLKDDVSKILKRAEPFLHTSNRT